MAWETKTLGEVCEVVQRGIAPKYTETDGVCVINQKCVRDHKVNYKLARRHNLNLRTVKPDRYVRKGDVLVNSTGTGTLGRVAQVRVDHDEPATVDTHVTIVRPLPGKFFSDLFGYMLIKIEDDIALSGEGASGQTELSRNVLKNNFKVSYPVNLQEQKRIVTILDQAFADIEKIRANTEKNLKNAHELFESYLQSFDSDRKPLGDFVNITTGKIDANAATQDGKYPFFTCAKEIFSIDNYAFDCEAILLAGNNAVGDFNVKHYQGKFNAYQRTYVITIHDNKRTLYRYLYYQLVNSLKEFKIRSVGAGTKFLKLGVIKNMKIPLPPLETQKNIINKLDLLSDKISLLENLYRTKLSELDSLKKSLLHQAFTGQLTKKEVAA
jgi:type I restriction enzyme S subunit